MSSDDVNQLIKWARLTADVLGYISCFANPFKTPSYIEREGHDGSL